MLASAGALRDRTCSLRRGDHVGRFDPYFASMLDDHMACPFFKILQNRKDAQMTKKTLDWTPDLRLPTGTGATFQKFKAQSGDDQLEIKATERGEGNLKVNATEIARVADDRDATEVFRDLEKIAEDYECAHQQVPHGLKSK
jgi:hypothetical protein